MPFWVQFIQAVGPAAIGVAALWIAYSQHKIARAKARNDLFDKRFEIYRGFRQLLFFANTKSAPSREDFTGLITTLDGADFLFTKRFGDKLRELVSVGLEWARLDDRARTASSTQMRESDWQRSDRHSERFYQLATEIQGDFAAKMTIGL